MLRLVTTVSLALAMLAMPSADAHAKGRKKAERKAGMGAYIKQKPDGVYVANVVKNLGADIAGIQKDDRIVSIDGTAIETKDDVGKVMPGTPCTTARIEVERGSDKLVMEEVLRVPVHSPGDCFGYYKFTTKTRRSQLRKVGRLMYKAWEDSPNKALVENLNTKHNLTAARSLEPLSSFLDDFASGYGVDRAELTPLENHAKEILQYLHDNMPEGQDGKWSVIRLAVRIQNEKRKITGGHADDDPMTVITPLLGRPSYIHPRGCKVDQPQFDYSDFVQGRSPGSLAFAGRDRFNRWRINRGSHDKAQAYMDKVPEALARLVDICGDGKIGKKSNFRGVPHERPEDMKKRVIFLLGAEFTPNR